jgi:lipid II:glycine glycyltransferase (peptidoglycan interpeptide bridge formation enzyme)
MALSATSLALVEPAAAEWDAFAATHPHGHLLQSSSWARLKAGVGWAVRRVALSDGGVLRAGAQLLVKRRFGLAAVYVPRGPLLSGDAAIDNRLLDACERLARRERAVFLRVEPNLLHGDETAEALSRTLERRGFVPAEPFQPRSSIQLDLAAPPDALLAAMSKGHRADIRRAAREGVTVRAGQGEADLGSYYDVMRETATRAGFGIHSRAYYGEAWRLFGEHALLLLAERAGRVVATCLVFAWAGTGTYLYGGSTDEGLRAGANHAVQWEALQWAQARGCRVYDFWGIPDVFGLAAGADEIERARLEAEAQHDPLFGVYRFKKGFGGRVVRYLPAYDRQYIPPLYRLWQRRMAS